MWIRPRTLLLVGLLVLSLTATAWPAQLSPSLSLSVSNVQGAPLEGFIQFTPTTPPRVNTFTPLPDHPFAVAEHPEARE
jgi:hypothetical protein